MQLMLGAPNHIYHGGLMHTSVRYFDPARQRPGIPRDVAALVERITPNGFRIQLVNLHPSESRDVILQAGMFGEHDFSRIKQVIHYPYEFYTINNQHVQIHLPQAAVGRLEIDLDRYVNQPTFAFPWHTARFPPLRLRSQDGDEGCQASRRRAPSHQIVRSRRGDGSREQHTITPRGR